MVLRKFVTCVDDRLILDCGNELLAIRPFSKTEEALGISNETCFWVPERLPLFSLSLKIVFGSLGSLTTGNPRVCPWELSTALKDS
tara:strand:- start:48 stop:305 length:258 start_codon:yes stop_codon:yes gene_type:complete